MPTDTSVDFRIVKVLEKIEDNPSETLPTLARYINLSNSRLSHLFKSETGVSLTAFLEQQRMKRAAELLRSTEMRVKEITHSIGYQHEPSFNRAFQKNFRCTPTDYRKQQRVLLRNSGAS